ncbi:MAG TPA: S41 family peptidase [Nevskiaceae bacterium]|nr:S41 family peptidase [Nevskiaceae bacterium]
MRASLRVPVALGVGVIIGVGVSLGHVVFADHPAAASSSALPVDDLQNFVVVMDRVRRDYVTPVSDKKLLNLALHGMLSGLDPHSSYMDAQEYKDMNAMTSGKFGGLGIEVTSGDGVIRVVSPIDDTPAAKAGIKPGDLIVKINDTAVSGLSLTDAVNIMRGKPGTKITLTIIRKDAPKPIVVTITREIIHVKSVRSKMLEPGYGYLRISQFSANTGDAVRQNVKDLEKQAGGHLKGLILDLRNNPGGVLTAAVTVANTFLDHGDIVSIRGRDPDSNHVWKAQPGQKLYGGPMVVLVNGGSASAAEIVTGALKDDRRAVVVGSRTFGKGSVQTIMPMANGTALRLTTARYYTPNGQSIQGEGILPNVEFQPVKVDVSDQAGLTIHESDLTGHLTNPELKEFDVKQSDAQKVDAAEHKLASKDYELYQALTILKGVAAVQAVNTGK